MRWRRKVEGYILGEVKKRERKCKGRIYIGFDFCKGGANKEIERGFCVKRGNELSPLANHGRPKKRERKGTFMRKSVELGIFVGKMGIVGILEIRKFFWLVKEGKENKRKEKGKGMRKEKIFSLT